MVALFRVRGRIMQIRYSDPNKSARTLLRKGKSKFGDRGLAKRPEHSVSHQLCGARFPTICSLAYQSSQAGPIGGDGTQGVDEDAVLADSPLGAFSKHKQHTRESPKRAEERRRHEKKIKIKTRPDLKPPQRKPY